LRQDGNLLTKGIKRDAVSRPCDSLDVYLADVVRTRCLSVEEEQELARAYRSNGDRRVAHRLVTSNLRFVVKIAREYRSYGIGLADLVQEGNVGLITAVEKFDPDRGVRLVTYAVWWIRASIHDFILRSWSLVKVGTTRSQRVNWRLGARDVSLDAPCGEGESMIRDLLPDHHPHQEHQLSIAQEQELLRVGVHEAMSRLGQRERHIIEQRVMRDSPATLVEIGAELDISPQRSLQLESRARKKLTRELEALAVEVEWLTQASPFGRRAGVGRSRRRARPGVTSRISRTSAARGARMTA
jgi:RNA polymerase sigma-32 factor